MSKWLSQMPVKSAIYFAVRLVLVLKYFLHLCVNGHERMVGWCEAVVTRLHHCHWDQSSVCHQPHQHCSSLIGPQLGDRGHSDTAATLLIGRRWAVTLVIGRGDREMVTLPLAPQHHNILNCCCYYLHSAYLRWQLFTQAHHSICPSLLHHIHVTVSSLCSSHILLYPAGWSFTMLRGGYHCDVILGSHHPFFVSSEQPLASHWRENIKTESIMSRNIARRRGEGDIAWGGELPSPAASQLFIIQFVCSQASLQSIQALTKSCVLSKEFL